MSADMIQKHLIYLFKEEPFYAGISRNVMKRERDDIPTAAVGFENRHLCLWYNPEFINDLTFDEVIAVLRHEFLHIAFYHLTDKRLAGFKNEDQQEAFNVAADLAINSFLEEDLPEMGVFAGTDKGGDQFADWPSHKTAEYYLDRIQQEQEKQKQQQGQCPECGCDKGQGEECDECEDGGCAGCGGMDLDGEALDQHDWFDDMSDTERKMLQERMQKALSDGQKRAATDGWGSVPQEIQDEIDANLDSGSVDWRKVLRRFVSTTTSDNKHSTIRRLNQKYPRIHPGSRKERVPDIAVSIDQSGSMSDDMLEEVAGELNQLAEMVDFTVIPFDTDISEDEIFEWDQGEKFKMIERFRCGGTDLAPATRWVNERDFQGHIMFTDMQAEKPPASHCKRMYCVPEGGAPMFETTDTVIELEKTS